MSRTNRVTGRAARLLVVLIGLVAGAALVSRPSRAAGEGDGPRYRVKLDIRAGQRWAFDGGNRTEFRQQVSADDQPQPPTEQVSAAVRKGTIDVLAVKDGVPTAIRVAFDPGCVNTTWAGGRSASVPFPLAGRMVTIRRDDAGNVTCDTAGLGGVTVDAAAAQELSELMDADRSTWPPRPVAVGDEWDADTARIARQFQLAPGDPIDVKCKLLRIGEVGGRRTADLSIAGTLRKAQPGGRLTITLGGVTQVDLETGQPLRSDVIGKLTSRGSVQTAGPAGPVAVRVSGEGKIEIHKTLAPVTPGPAPVTPASSPVTPASSPVMPASSPVTPAPSRSGGRSGGGG